MHEDAGGWKPAQTPLEGSKRKRPVLYSPLGVTFKATSNAKTTDKPSCIKNCSISRDSRSKAGMRVTMSKNVNEGGLLLERGTC
jgi:hypothetical protein